MKLRLLLWLMAVMYKRAIRQNSDMREYLEEVDKTIQFTTEKKNVTRFLQFQDQRLLTKAKLAKEADTTIQFCSAKDGFRILTAMATGKDKNAFMRAIQDKQLVVEGDYRALMWFQKSLRYLR